MAASYLTHLECSGCGMLHEPEQLSNLCPECGEPLLARYNLDQAAKAISPRRLRGREASLWRYRELLPVRRAESILTLGEGWTPLLPAKRLARRVGRRSVYIKDESQNPTGSFKARGLSVAVSRAYELGATALSIPSAGNAASALSAYAALGGLPCHVFLPADTPHAFVAECQALGANVTRVGGLITDCAQRARQAGAGQGWFDMSTFREPYRVEGKKTMGYELAEQLGWRLPDVIIYPTGGGTGLVGLWKAFEEMESLGWIGPQRPRMVAVQASGCAPIVKAFHAGSERAEPWLGASTLADGLRVPAAIADFLILRVLRKSGGTALAVSDDEMLHALRLVGCTEGLFVCPEGAATVAALFRLCEQGWIDKEESVVLLNTGSGLKYTHLFRDDRHRAADRMAG